MKQRGMNHLYGIRSLSRRAVRPGRVPGNEPAWVDATQTKLRGVKAPKQLAVGAAHRRAVGWRRSLAARDVVTVTRGDWCRVAQIIAWVTPHTVRCRLMGGECVVESTAALLPPPGGKYWTDCHPEHPFAAATFVQGGAPGLGKGA